MSTENESPPAATWSFPMYLRRVVRRDCGDCAGLYLPPGNVVRSATRLVHWIRGNRGPAGLVDCQSAQGPRHAVIFFGIVDAFIKTNISGPTRAKDDRDLPVQRRGCVCDWADHHQLVAARRSVAGGVLGVDGWGYQVGGNEKLDVVTLLKKHIPKAFAPFVKNEITGVVILAVLAGIALRGVRKDVTQESLAEVTLLEQAMSGGFVWMMKILEYVILLVPFAVCGILAAAIAKEGLKEFFESLAVFLSVVLAGLGIHAFVYYPLVNWLLGGKSPLFFREGGKRF